MYIVLLTIITAKENELYCLLTIIAVNGYELYVVLLTFIIANEYELLLVSNYDS
jgi:hypothetical protein